jgi:hypothetical protein
MLASATCRVSSTSNLAPQARRFLDKPGKRRKVRHGGLLMAIASAMRVWSASLPPLRLTPEISNGELPNRTDPVFSAKWRDRRQVRQPTSPILGYGVASSALVGRSRSGRWKRQRLLHRADQGAENSGDHRYPPLAEPRIRIYAALISSPCVGQAGAPTSSSHFRVIRTV